MTEAYDAVNPLLDDDDEETVAERKPWEAPTRTPEEEAVAAEKKRRGTMPTGRKKSWKTLTLKDATLLAFLGKFRAATVEQLSMLMVAGDSPKAASTGDLMSPRTIADRLTRLQGMGAVESQRLWTGERIYAATQRGITAAIGFDLIGAEGEVNGRGLSGLNMPNLPHLLAVNQVAAQLVSPRGYFRESLKFPPLTLEYLMSESQVLSAWTKVNKQLAAERKEGDRRERRFKDWRADTIRLARAEAISTGVAWSSVLDFYPALWALAQQPKPGDDLREHHIPDLIVNVENMRKSEKTVSIAIEVELHAKTAESYRKQFELWAAEFIDIPGRSSPIVYSKLVYFTNSPRVIRTITEVDRVLETNLIETGKLSFHPITQRDGTTPLTMRTRL